MGDLQFFHKEDCFLCTGKGVIETDTHDFYGHPDQVECPCCHGAGELRVYGKDKPNN